MSRHRYKKGSPARGLVRLSDYLNHRRIVLFWAVAVVGLAAPWLVRAVADAPTSAVAGDMLSCEVASIYDGDTMRVRCDGQLVKVRLYCIDAPEMGQKPWGRESRDYLRSITPERVLIRPVTKDRYGRTVGEVFPASDSGRSLGLVMVGAGQAAVYQRYCSAAGYRVAAADAEVRNVGIWSKTGLQRSPWAWRANMRQ